MSNRFTIEDAMTTPSTPARVEGTLDPMLAPEHLRVWTDIVEMCQRGGWASINVASKQRMAAILAVDAALRANADGEGCRASRHTPDPLVGSSVGGDK